MRPNYHIGLQRRHRQKNPLSAMTDDQWDLTIDVDLKGMMRSPSIRQPEARLPW
jgi:hypothetical protein